MNRTLSKFSFLVTLLQGSTHVILIILLWLEHLTANVSPNFHPGQVGRNSVCRSCLGAFFTDTAWITGSANQTSSIIQIQAMSSISEEDSTKRDVGSTTWCNESFYGQNKGIRTIFFPYLVRQMKKKTVVEHVFFSMHGKVHKNMGDI